MACFAGSGLAAFDGFQNPCCSLSRMGSVVGFRMQFEFMIGGEGLFSR